jgi:hypothetical protein
MGIVEGVDSKGRRYRFVNGKRVANEAHVPKTREIRPRDNDEVSRKVRDAIVDIKHIHGSSDIGRVIVAKFHNLLSTTARTAVGRYGQLFAARFILALMRNRKAEEPLDEDDPDVKDVVNADGSLNLRHFKAKVEEYSAPKADMDAAILDIVHNYGLTPSRLRTILREKFAQ